MLFYLVTALYVLVCFTMMLVVYLQQGKGGDIASAFGGGGSSQSAFGARSGATVLSRATTIAAILFMVGALALGIIGRRIGSHTWELLLAMLVMEAAFGIAGVIAAPIYYAFVKDELANQGLL